MNMEDSIGGCIVFEEGQAVTCVFKDPKDADRLLSHFKGVSHNNEFFVESHHNYLVDYMLVATVAVLCTSIVHRVLRLRTQTDRG